MATAQHPSVTSDPLYGALGTINGAIEEALRDGNELMAGKLAAQRDKIISDHVGRTSQMPGPMPSEQGPPDPVQPNIPNADPSTIPPPEPGFSTRQPRAAAEYIPPEQRPGMLESFGRGALQGGTVFAGDEILGAAKGEQARDELRRANKAAQAENPWSYTAGMALGGVVPQYLLSKIPGGNSLLGLVGSTGQRIAGGATGGALTGTVEGFAEGEGLDDRIRHSAAGGVLGLLTGTANPAVARYIGGPIADAFTSRFAPNAYARRSVRRAMEDAGMTPQMVDATMARAASQGQPDFTVMDALGESGRSVLNWMTRSPGKEGNKIKDAMEARQGLQGERVEDILRQGLGASETGEMLRDKMWKIRSAEAKANYDPLRADPANASIWGPEFDALLSRPSVQEALERAAKVARERGQPVPRNPFVKDPKTGEYVLPAGATPDFHFLENLKVAMEKKNINEHGVILDSDVQKTIKELTGALDTKVPGYAAARLPYKQASDAMDAIDAGRKAAQSGLHQDVIDQISKQPLHIKQAFRTGYSDTLAARMQGKTTGGDAGKPLDKGKIKEELEHVATDPQAASLMIERLGREAIMKKSHDVLTTGSQTARNLADQIARGVGEGTGLGALGGAADWYFGGKPLWGGPGMTLGATIGAGGRLLRNVAASPGAKEAIMKALLSGDPQLVKDLIKNPMRGNEGRLSVPFLNALSVAGREELRPEASRRIENFRKNNL